MDNLLKYQQILSDFLNEYGTIPKNISESVKHEILIDLQHNHFQLLSIGWQNSKYVYTIAFHLSIINGKIWLLQNNTDLMIADELMQKGIERENIVLGFVQPDMRPYTGFAAA